MDKKFLTLFFESRNLELIKDVGQIPYHMLRYMYSELVTSRTDAHGENTDKVNGLKLTHFPTIISSKLSGFLYLYLNRKKIKWLNIYHIDKKSLYWTKFFKFINSKGLVYLKMDADFRMCDDFDSNIKRRNVLEKCAESVDLISVESEAVKDRIKKYIKSKDIKVIPNGYCIGDRLDTNTVVKENVFLTVGRLGTEQKATENLLEAFEKISDKTDWNLHLVGSIEEEFKNYIKNYFSKYPSMKERVFFLGTKNSRNELDEEYRKAKVFVLPSRWESFGLVLTEAMANGCRVIATDVIPPINEITNKGRYGDIIEADSIEQLSEAMLKSTRYDYSDSVIRDISNYTEKNFSWSSICGRLYSYMKEVEKAKENI